jgi:competence protein ComEC
MMTAALLAAQPANRDANNALQVYLIDVEGGQATLFLTPAGQSLLIDTGWPGYNGRDADRIAAAAKQAGISKIDYVLITHYHRDHVGGVTQLAARIPIGAVIDHGENRERTADTEQGWQEYQQLIAAKHLQRVIAKPGDTLPIRGIDARVVSADGALITAPVTGSGAGEANSACNAADSRSADNTENARSLGVVIGLGKLRILDLGDLTWDNEVQLMCPVNRLGKVDVYIVSHHGSEQSGSPALVNGIAPRVALMDNGADKGGSASAWEIVEKSPRLEDLWQLHFANAGGSSHNVSEAFIANLAGPDAGNYLKLTGWPDGSFEVWNSRTRQTRHYEAK